VDNVSFQFPLFASGEKKAHANLGVLVRGADFFVRHVFFIFEIEKDY